jgi:hypothetical protein
MDSIIGFTVVLCGFAVIYFIANMVGCSKKNANSITSDDGLAKEGIHLSNSEKPLCRIVTTASPWWIKFFEVVIIILVIRGVFVAIDEINNGIFVWSKRNIELVIILLGSPTLVSLLSSKVIFDDAGITMKVRLLFLFFTFHNKCTLIPWNHISFVYYENSISKGQPFIFTTTKVTTRVLFWNPNYRNSLIFAINKIPRHKFTVTAQEKLKEMGIW